jgi:hypothetical protein
MDTERKEKENNNNNNNKKRSKNNKSPKLILRGSKGVGVTIESYGKVEISYINVDKF